MASQAASSASSALEPPSCPRSAPDVPGRFSERRCRGCAGTSRTPCPAPGRTPFHREHGVAPGTRTPIGKSVSANQIPVFGDSTWYDAWPQHTDSPSLTPDAFGIMDQGTSGEMNHFCIDRHDGFLNLVFMDWSARRVGLKELWTLKWNRNYLVNGPWTKAGGARPEDWPVWLRLYKDY